MERRRRYGLRPCSTGCACVGQTARSGRAARGGEASRAPRPRWRCAATPGSARAAAARSAASCAIPRCSARRAARTSATVPLSRARSAAGAAVRATQRPARRAGAVHPAAASSGADRRLPLDRPRPAARHAGDGRHGARAPGRALRRSCSAATCSTWSRIPILRCGELRRVLRPGGLALFQRGAGSAGARGAAGAGRLRRRGRQCRRPRPGDRRPQRLDRRRAALSGARLSDGSASRVPARRRLQRPHERRRAEAPNGGETFRRNPVQPSREESPTRGHASGLARRPPAADETGGLVAGGRGGPHDTAVGLAVRIRERHARPPEHLLELQARPAQLVVELAVGERREPPVGDRVRADLPARRGERVELLPAEDARDADRVDGDEDRSDEAEPLEQRTGGARDGGGGVVEGDGDDARGAGARDCIRERGAGVAPAEEPAQLALQQLRRDLEQRRLPARPRGSRARARRASPDGRPALNRAGASRRSRPCTCRRRGRAASAAGSARPCAASGARRTRRRARCARPTTARRGRGSAPSP